MKLRRFFAQDKPLFHRWWIYALSFIFILIIPYFIDRLYFIGLGSNKPNTFMQANDWLSYYGAILTMIGAAVGIFVSIQYSQQNYRDDILKRVLPFITLHRYSCDFKSSFLDGLLEDKKPEKLVNEFKINPVNSIYFFLRCNHVEWATTLTEEQEHSIHFATDFKKVIEGKTYSTNYHPRDLVNVGEGTAVDLRIEITTNEIRYPSPIQISLLPGQKILMGIYVETEIDQPPVNEYLISLYYSNIYGDEYLQQWSLKPTSTGYFEQNTIRQKKLVGLSNKAKEEVYDRTKNLY